ncbi:MAG: RsmB/NOP family class I SAM-dependent RNA methyltransferase [Emcibacter sp.]|nr:RsmB/NOP family class I SAM-dependent RNA methyltransferase [Emcibacter sp.]
MIEPARIQAAIDILDQVASSLLHDGPSADVLIRKYFRTRRYAGSKDRRAITDMVYSVIRNWGFLSDISKSDTRRMILLSLPQETDFSALFTGNDHAPTQLTDEEQKFLKERHDKEPHDVLNYPNWLESRLLKRFPDNFNQELEHLNGRASFELRVNLGKTTVAKVETFLKAENIEFSRGKLTESAFILEGNPRIDDWDIYKNGDVEIQDEAAQLAVLLSDIKPSFQVMDLCAGAGGKTLAAAAFMNNKGQIYAYDNNYARLKDLKPRAKRADARIIQAQHLDTAGGKRKNILSEHVGRMDRVILDVPCSGSGVWRRNPELKWRLNEEKLLQYCRIQKNLINEGWDFVKHGGRMIYMTCSLLYDENEDQIMDFLNNHADARLVSYNDIYKKQENNNILKTLSEIPECLALSPYSHGSDGFFVAIVEKIKLA